MRFEPRAQGGTEAVVEHTGFERHGADAAAYRGAMASEHGWPALLRGYADLAGRWESVR